MALKKYSEGTKDCTAALDIEPGYMKAILRRARCRARSKNYAQSTSDYNSWLKMAAEPSGGSYKSALREEIESVKRELREVVAAERDEIKERDRARWFEKNFNRSERASSGR